MKKRSRSKEPKTDPKILARQRELYHRRKERQKNDPTFAKKEKVLVKMDHKGEFRVFEGFSNISPGADHHESDSPDFYKNNRLLFRAMIFLNA